MHISAFLFVCLVTGLWYGATCSSSTSWLSRCALEGVGELKHVYVSTLDGKLSALDASGRRQWRYKFTQPFYSSSLSYTEASSHSPILIPGLDKKLYLWDGALLTPLSLSMEELIEEGVSPAHSSRAIRAGGRTKEDVALDVATGKPLYHCTQYKCHKNTNQSLIGNMDQLLVSSHRTIVREADRLSGEEMWNFTVSRLQLSLLEGEGGYDQEDVSCQVGGAGASDWVFNADSTNGILFVSNSYTKISWNYKFPSPIMDVWFHQGGKLEKVFLSPLQYPSKNKPALLLGAWRNQYYIQPAVNRDTSSFNPWNTRLVDNVRYYGNDELCNNPSHPTYSPTFPSDAEGEDSAMTLFNAHQNWLNKLSTHGPNGLALYFQSIDSDTDHAHCYRELENTSDDDSSKPHPPHQTAATAQEGVPMEQPGFFIRAFEYSRSIFKYLIFAAIVLAVNKLKRYYRRNNRSPTHSESEDGSDEVFRTLNDLGPGTLVPSAFDRRRSSSSTIKPTPTYELLPILEEDSGPPIYPADKLDSSDLSASRLETEYHFLGVLGRGGFGVVCHVKNRTDGIEYALKRIKLPEKKFARDKVMREVHALAQLDHPHIVRYFNSWVEKAPPNWDQREEWVPLSRVGSLVKMDDMGSSARHSPLPPSSSSLSRPFTSSPTPSWSLPSSNGHLPLSSFQSFTPDLPPMGRSDSHSSFTIEFRDDSQSKLSGDEGGRCNSPIRLSSLSNGRKSSLSATDSYYHGNQTTQSSETTDDRCSSTDQLSTDARPHPQSYTPSFVFIQMQLCRKESLKDWLKGNIHNRPRYKIWAMFEQILDAVMYVHNKGLMHRDLKPSNIFFSLDGGIKVGDFGLVTGHVTPDTHNNSFNVLKHLGQESDGTRHTGNIGTHFYVSPEQMMGLKYDQKVDIFSLGVILFELNHPFSTEMERAKILEDVRKCKFPNGFKKHLQHEAVFVEWLMSPVAKRPTAHEVYNSSRLWDLKEMILHADLSYIPKL